MASRHAQLDLDLQLCFPLYAASRAVVRAYGPLLSEVGLTYPQYLVLLALWGVDEPMTVGELGRRLRLDTGTLTPLLKRLERAGHVRRSRDEHDERRVLVAVTEQGRALQEDVAHVPAAIVEALRMDLDDAVRLRTLLDQVIDELDPAT
jgi:MarR family transcriptional regulator, organic hydroperoxide resistance regulator